MQKLWRLIYSRTFLIVLTLVLTLVLYFTLYQTAVALYPFTYGILELFSIGVAVSIINRPINTSFKLAWILFVVALPIFGALLYFILKTNVETRRYEKTFRKQAEQLKGYGQISPKVSQSVEQQDKSQLAFARYMSEHAGMPMHSNTEAVYLPSGEEKFTALLAELEKAERYIFMEYFIVAKGYMWDSILSILKKKAAEGVEVRFLYDGSNSLSLLPYTYYKELRQYGIQAKVFSQIIPALSTIQNNRDHRKIAVIDGKVAITGGVNLADEYINQLPRFGHWKDAAILVRGEAVLNFTRLFLQMWNFNEKHPNDDARYLQDIQSQSHSSIQTDSFYLPYGESPFDKEDVAKRVYLEMIQSARETIYIMTPYLVLDDEMIDNLIYAAQRGVAVIIVLPHIYDKLMPYLVARTDFATYLTAGIRLYEYTPGFVHSKVVLVDDCKATVGTVNMDFRSFYLNFECGLYLYNDHTVLTAIKQDFLDTLSKSQEITRETFATYPLWKRLAGAVLKIISPLL